MSDTLTLIQRAGDHVVVEAVPGAGKTHMIVELASTNSNSLILAYNNALSLEIQTRIDPDRVSCFTFHSLCSRFVRVVCDDLQLQHVVEEVERGELLIEKCSLHATTILIDEAQDVRPIYIRLLRILGLLDIATKIYVFGDRNQLIYDYDEDFPACLDVLTRPNTHVRRGVSWKRVVASTSHRLPSPVARIVSDMFSVRIGSVSRDDVPPPPLVEVRAPTSMFRLSHELNDLKEVPHLILVDRRANNRPLHALLNDWSREGMVMNVHRTTNNHENATMTCATYWSAKGLQHDTVVVIVPECTPRNPLYVALTRARRRLIVVIDARKPHVALCQTLDRNPDFVSPPSMRVKRILASVRGHDPDASLSGWTRSGTAPVVPVVRVGSPRRSRVTSAFDDDTHLPPEVLVNMALVWCEIRATGVCRRVEEVFQPLFLDRNAENGIRVHGYVGRAIPPRMSENMLLSPDLRVLLHNAYTSLLSTPTLDELCILNLYDVAYITQSYNGFECVARQRNPDPVITPYDHDRIEWVQGILHDATQFDLPTTHAPSTQRIHARGPTCSYHVVSQSTSDDEKQVALRCERELSCVLVHVDAWTTTSVSLA